MNAYQVNLYLVTAKYISIFKPNKRGFADSKEDLNRQPEFPLPTDYIPPSSYPEYYENPSKPPLITQSPFPQFNIPHVIKESDSSLRQQQQHQRTFLLTTILPVCILIVVVLLVVLMIIWFLKFRGNGSKGKSGVGDADDDVDCNDPRKPLSMKDERISMKKNGISCMNEKIRCEFIFHL